MTEQIYVAGNCPVCKYSFERTITDNEVQTALSNYNDTQDAVQHFCGGEVPITPSLVVNFVSLVAGFITISEKLLENHSVSEDPNADVDSNCPRCGNSDYEIEVEQK